MDAINAGLRSHCTRVAAWAQELAGSLRLTAEEERLLEQAALLHHYPLEMVETETLKRLAGDLWPVSAYHPARRVSAVPLSVRAILEWIRKPGGSRRADRISALANILDLADLFDEQLEIARFEGRSVREVLETALADPILGSALHVMRKSDRRELLAMIPNLPVYPAAALKALTALAKPDVDIRDVEDIAKTDQVLCGHLLKAANSAFFSPRHPLKTVRDAITYIGTDTARNILSAAALRPLYQSRKLKQLWKHSIESGGGRANCRVVFQGDSPRGVSGRAGS